ncbi:threonine synthase [Bernardetia litoralis DSM 6794]|uniref:Threonine synthase n=1 Tax=Bernardetia litoralis (strain ATCC 23117 / DSM 6794 / NBRC 15988 / NCIMB 1366 / Fx l1 / Sio-4) TaxID=880071 RepID=I4AJB2_BERLS|nr:threonine synthase [Bernardetia litoralis]AFM04047.1 threonine synthase [Bernardetia litoralis DSM 6794]
MNYSSTNGDTQVGSLCEALFQTFSSKGGLLMPEVINLLPKEFLLNLHTFSFQEICLKVCLNLFGDEIPEEDLAKIIQKAFNFEIPLVEIYEKEVYSLELFHGKTLSFKDIGMSFMAELMSYFLEKEKESQDITVLVATTGDTGSAAASAFFKRKGIKLCILYPKNKLSLLQEKQLNTWGENITALEIDGTYEDCKNLVREVLIDKELNKKIRLTTANSHNIARLLPQCVYYFWAVAQLKGEKRTTIFSVPSGNFGNLTAGIIAKKMGLRISRFIAATNINDVVPQYLLNGSFEPRPAIRTISSSMDTGNPVNFKRLLTLYNHSYTRFSADIAGYRLTDRRTKNTLKDLYEGYNYLADPHSTVAYAALKNYLTPESEVGIFLASAHPVKYYEVVKQTIPDVELEMPSFLEETLRKEKKVVSLSSKIDGLKAFLSNTPN